MGKIVIFSSFFVRVVIFPPFLSVSHVEVILAGSVQLVGIAILVFVKASDIEVFRGFQIMKRKTAASGFAGNKGALSARFEYDWRGGV
jgi:hypothetical protein